MINSPNAFHPDFDLAQIDPERHLVIAGPTASGKSSLALAVARRQGGLIVNADALQIWSCWRVLTARPSAADEAETAHALYGHVSPDRNYSVGDWLRDVGDLRDQRLIIVGGTGLYLTALTRGLAYVPPTAPEIRAEGDRLLTEPDGLQQMLASLDPATAHRIDVKNPARVQRAWEVFIQTGRGLAEWQADTPAPLMAASACQAFVLQADREWLAQRIAARFHAMMKDGALDEVQGILPHWNPQKQWARAIGAPELVAYLHGKRTRDEAVDRAIIATRQYAKSQRIWFRNRMRDWSRLSVGPKT